MILVFCILGLLLLFCDQVSSHVFKPIFQRLRPTHHPDFKDEVRILFGYRGGLYGFISGHAANTFGFATLTSLMIRNKIFTLMIFIFALLTGYSRIYLGVHFINDVVVGAIVGIVLGYIVYRIYLLGRLYILGESRRKLKESVYTSPQAYFLTIVYVIMVAGLFIFNEQLVGRFV